MSVEETGNYEIAHYGKGEAALNDEGTLRMYGHAMVKSASTGGSCVVFAVEMMTEPPAPDEGNIRVFSFELRWLTISTREGLYRFEHDIVVKERHAGNDKFAFVLVLSVGLFSYTTHNTRQPVLMRVPLLNFVSSFDDVSDVVKGLESRDVQPVIMLDGETFHGFIQQVPDYQEKLIRLNSGKTRREVTAFIVWKAESVDSSYQYCKSSVLNGILPLLSFATGFDVGTAWVEFLDKDIQVVSRQYVNWTTESYINGHAVLGEGMHSSIGPLLNAGFCSEHSGQLYLRAALLKLLRAGSSYLTFEARLSNLFSVLDNLCEHFGLFKVDVPADAKRAVKNILKEAANQVQALTKRADDNGEEKTASVLRKFENQIANAGGLRRSYGEAVETLIAMRGFADQQPLWKFFSENPREDQRDWKQVLSYYRGIVMHRGYFETESSRERKEQSSIAIHLYDCAIRIVLHMLGYNEEYRSPIGMQIKKIDWVTTETTPQALGFGVVPILDRPGVRDAIMKELEARFTEEGGSDEQGDNAAVDEGDSPQK